MKWHRTKILVSLRINEDLGINTNDAEYVPCVIDLDEIESFHWDEDYEGNKCTVVKFKSGESFSIKEDFEMFVKRMNREMGGGINS